MKWQSSGKSVQERMMVVFTNLNSTLCMRIGRAEVGMTCSYPQSFVMKCESEQKSSPPSSGIADASDTNQLPQSRFVVLRYVKCTFEKISGVLRKSAMNLLEHCTSTFQNPNTGLRRRKSCYLQDELLKLRVRILWPERKIS